MAKHFWNTTEKFIANGKISPVSVGDIIETQGYSTKGDGGGAQWKLTAVTGTASQSPAQLGDALLNDANGSQWSLVVNGPVNVLSLGVVSSTNSTLQFQATGQGN